MIRELFDVPGLIHDRRFREGARRLLAEGRSAGEIARVVRIAGGDLRAWRTVHLSLIDSRGGFGRLRARPEENQLRHLAASREEQREREREQAKERERLLREREDLLAESDRGSHSAAALEEGEGMSEELNTRTIGQDRARSTE